MSDSRPSAEFDAYSEGYQGGSENAFKGLIGGGFSAFIEVKAEWLLRDLAAQGLADPGTGSAPSLLDYGCGTGILLSTMRRLGFEGSLAGCDVSSGMLEAASRTWQDSDAPRLRLIEGDQAPYEDRSFDLIVASGVLHHVDPGQRDVVYRDLDRLLRPGGRIYVFEHNPLNPLTRWVVGRTPIDENAVLLRANEVQEGFSLVGLESIRTEYLMFFPPRLPKLRRLERWLRWLPLGGQYVVGGSRPISP